MDPFCTQSAVSHLSASQEVWSATSCGRVTRPPLAQGSEPTERQVKAVILVLSETVQGQVSILGVAAIVYQDHVCNMKRKDLAHSQCLEGPKHGCDHRCYHNHGREKN